MRPLIKAPHDILTSGREIVGASFDDLRVQLNEGEALFSVIFFDEEIVIPITDCNGVTKYYTGKELGYIATHIGVPYQITKDVYFSTQVYFDRIEFYAAIPIVEE